MIFMSKKTANGARGGEYIVEARGLTKVYDTGKVRVEALKGIDLGVRRGEMVAIMGPSGCGKTTFLNCVTGLDAFTAGDVAIEGVSITKMNDNRRTEYRAKRMGFVFQSYNLLPVLTAVENVELPLLLTSLGGAERKKRAQTALRIVGLEDRMQHYPRQLSGGQEQRVAIARAIVNDPTIIVADEPTGDLDRKAADEILGLLDQLNTKLGKTIFMVTHDPAAAERAKIIRRLDKGKLAS
jgi:putative ABC transport system ATP-binding protein